MAEPVLSVRGLRVEFRLEDAVVRAVDGLSYDLRPGETLAVVGESGCGKSVHALTIMRLLPSPPARVAAGRIVYRGRDLLELSEDELRALRGDRIGMIFQEPMTSLNPVLTIGEQIAESVALHRRLGADAAWAKAADLLAKVGIPAPERRCRDYPHQFSGGMRQRAMIAMALACGPDILLADEPTTALDVTIQAQILELLASLQKELGMAVILITHNVGVVARMADDVVVMYAGRAVERGGVREVFASPGHPYTRGLMGSVPSIHGRAPRLKAVPGQPPELTAEFRACPFAPRCPEVMERCRREDPPDYLLAGGRMANCFLLEGQAEAAAHRYEAAAAA